MICKSNRCGCPCLPMVSPQLPPTRL
ncbi:Protein of unknown function [Gryllus bimaculatus]|nr:Protein of unknown function [Gryllus bimaculatus]